MILIHGGNITDWDYTKIPEPLKNAYKDIPTGVKLKNKFTNQDYWVVYDDNKTITLSTMHNVIYYPKDLLWEHFKEVENIKTQ